MKKAIIISLAVVGGITLTATAIVGTAVAVEAVKDKRKLAKMTPEEREAENLKRAAIVSALLETYGKKRKADVVEETAEAEIISVEEFEIC